MHHSNHFYGHAHILARYAGLPDEAPPRIWGYLQHGWNLGDGFAPGMKPDIPGFPRFVWSERVRRNAQAMGRRDTVVIGAPWQYLISRETLPPGSTDDPREGTIWYPFHGWEGQEVLGDHQRLIREILDIESGPVTVCLYWKEFEETGIRRQYLDAGFRLITHGRRGLYYRDSDPQFLRRQHAELRTHARVASNRLSSAVLYGISVGCQPAVYGDPMAFGHEDPVIGSAARSRRLFPELHGTTVDQSCAAEFAAKELGVRAVLSPEEMRLMFRWEPPHRRWETR